MNLKWVSYIVADIGALAWLYYGIIGELPLEAGLGLSSSTASILYLGIGATGVLSLFVTATMLDDIDASIDTVAFLLADLAAIAWLYFGATGMLPVEDILGLSTSTASLVYIGLGIAGAMSFILSLSAADPDSPMEMPE